MPITLPHELKSDARRRFDVAPRKRLRRALLLAVSLAFVSVPCLPPARAQEEEPARAEYRAFWVDTFNTALNTPADVDKVINNTLAANCNAIFAQVRRRGDSWYLNSLEPPADRTPLQPGFDPLLDLITKAHARGLEVHAFVIMGAVWGRAPNLFPPESPNHVFNLHGGFNPATNTITPGPNNWLTRTLLPDSAASQIAYQGHRFGSDFWLDFGHPDAAAYTANVVRHLVESYDIDGLHLDRIRYPELSVSGQTPATGTNIGYNPTSVERFQRRRGIEVGSPAPAPNDPLWSQWRRDQVTNVVRRVYLEALAVKPKLKVSAALIAFGGGPTTEASWNSAEAYWRVYQDWRAWTEEGIIDIAIPMVYKAEHVAAQRAQFDQWNEWTRNHQYNRGAMLGLGASVNAVEGTLRQTRRALEPSALGNRSLGVIYFSMATSNVAVAANPFAIPPGSTPVRPFAELAAGLTTGESVDRQRRYEPAGLTPIFGLPALIPTLPWKEAPQYGHAKGFALDDEGKPLDTAPVTIERLDAAAPPRTTATDGNGFYGAVDLAPGRYRATAALGPVARRACFDVTPGAVADALADVAGPTTAAAATPSSPTGDNGWYTGDVTIALEAADDCSGVARTEYSIDGGATWAAYAGGIAVGAEGTTTILYRSADEAGNVEEVQTLSVKIDQTAPPLSLSADPSTIWPPDGRQVEVTIAGAGSDAVSGLAGVTYVVADEYGAPLGINPRALAGAAAEWSESLQVEARRHGRDRDGRVYRVTATLRDAAGNTATATATILVPHDQRRGR